MAIIRPYQTKDRAELRKIFQDTAFHGESFKNFFDDGEWLADFMTLAYTEGEPASSFVAEENQHVVGYLTGTLNTDRYVRNWKRIVLPKIISGFFSEGVCGSRRAWQFFWNGIKSGLAGEQSSPPKLSRIFPAHFHINIASAFRGQGIGKKLAVAFFEHMRAQKVYGVHVRTAYQEEHQPFFEALGFEKLHARRLTLWDYLQKSPYHLFTYGLSLLK